MKCKQESPNLSISTLSGNGEGFSVVAVCEVVAVLEVVECVEICSYTY